MPNVTKVIHRRFLTYLASPLGATVLVLAAVTLIACFARALTDISHVINASWGSKDLADNISGRRFDHEMCPEPIDVVYTWVNGSDPLLAELILQYKPSPSPSATPSSSASPSSSPSASPSFNSSVSGLPGDSTDDTRAEDADADLDEDSDHQDDGSGMNRFRDNNELRYSLRSIEKYAPWVRHIYIVTNGQVPNWLDLTHPRITLITHAEIFKNKSHLPVFSSPAIESHLHRIPGITRKFIYFNDDVFLGSDTWPADFHTKSSGQKVFLAWEVPKCNPGCMETWIGDGFCDQACNVSSCNFDFPDCVNGSNVNSHSSTTSYSSSYTAPTGYCATGCPGSWLGDLVCDSRCDTVECGWDAGDCGIDKVWDGVPGAAVAAPHDIVPINMSHVAAYVNMSAMFDAISDAQDIVITKLEEASHSQCDGIRTAVLNEPDQVLILVLGGAWNDCVDDTPDPSSSSPSPPHASADYNSSDVSIDNNSTSSSSSANTTAPLGVHNETLTSGPKPISVTVWISYTTEDASAGPIETHFILQFVKPSPAPEPEYLNNYNGVPSDPYPQGVLYGGYGEDVGADYGFLGADDDMAAGFRGGGDDDVMPGYGGGGGLRRRLLASSVPYLPPSGIAKPGRTYARIRPQEGDRISLPTSSSFFQTAKPHELAAVVRLAWRRALTAAHHAVSNGWSLSRHDPTDSVLQEIRLGSEGAVGASSSNNDDELAVSSSESDSDSDSGARPGSRRLLDAFADSLIFTNRMLNKEFKRVPRKVMAHMPHMIDIQAMQSLQQRFPTEWDQTSSHRFRHPEDVQFAFAYFYWLMEGGAQEGLNVDTYWRRELDTDGDGELNDNELRTLAAVVVGGHPTEADIHKLKNCLAPPTVTEETVNTAHGSTVVTKTLYPRITMNRMMECEMATQGLSANARFPRSHEESTLNEVSFEMVTDDYNRTLKQLDAIRGSRLKFVCVNDDMKQAPPEVSALLRDFYESYFPLPSMFELPAGTTNPHLYIDELRGYLHHRWMLKMSWVVFIIVGCGWVLSHVASTRYLTPEADQAVPSSPGARGGRLRRRKPGAAVGTTP